MILLDLETDGLVKASAMPLEEQARIVEVGMIWVDEDLEEIRNFHTLVNPGRPIDKDASKVHGITDAMVKDAPEFASVFQEMAWSSSVSGGR